MKIQYNVTGAQRKSFAQAVAGIAGGEARYLGAPSFAYEAGGYRILKDGTLEGADNPGLVADLQGLHGFAPAGAEYDSPLPEAEPILENIPIPYVAALGGRVSPYRDFEDPPAYGTPTDETDSFTIELPRASMSDAAIENLRRLVAGKAALIQKALAADSLDIRVTDERVRFPWFQRQPDTDTIRAFATLAGCLAAQAIVLQRVNATSKVIENEKYAFRVFLLRLGMIGDEYKAVRKTLLKNLPGNSAFKSGVPEKAEEPEDE